MKNLNDLRVIKTQKAIIEAFIQLLSQRPFEDITVNDICECAVVRRATFYNHFADKYELFSKTLQYIQKSYMDTLSTNHSDSFLDTLEISLTYMEQNERLFTAIVKSRYAAVLMGLFSEQLAAEIEKYLKKNCPTDPPSELTTQLLTGALMQAAGWWFLHRKEVSKTEVTAQVKQFILNAISS